MMRSKKQPQSLRPVSATEREALMYLGRGATQFALNPVESKRQPQLLEDTRCSLVGNSLNAGIVALLLAPPMVMRGILKEGSTPQNIVDRMGLRPAEVAVVGQSYQLPRAVGPHRFDGLRRGYVHPSVQDAAKACDAQSMNKLELATLHALVRSSEYRGSDVRLDSGELLRPGSWP